MNRKRILLSAYYFNPYQGSESAVGWNIATRLAQYHDVTVITGDLSDRRPHEKDLQRWHRESASISGLTIEYVPPSRTVARYEHWHTLPGLWFMWYKAYQKWQALAYQRACKLHAQTPFDLTHHLTVIGYREPGYLWRLPIPFVWGPVNGADNIPVAFYRFLGRAALGPVVRDVVNNIQMRLPGRHKTAAAVARQLWAVTTADQRMITMLWRKHADIMIETGTTLQVDNAERKQPENKTLHLVYSGIFVARKGLPFLLAALSGIELPVPWSLHILGDGPCREHWQNIANKLGLNQHLIWHGQVTRASAMEVMRSADIFVHPSLKEGTPHVVLEALALGVPVICHDACGMGAAVTDNCGIKIPLINPSTTIAGLRRAIVCIGSDADLRARLSAGALARAAELTWDKKARTIADTYERIIDGVSSC